jgi:hypothetical protein
MNKKRLIKSIGVLAGAVLLLGKTFAQNKPTTVTNSTAWSFALEEVVVSANRNEQKLKDVPQTEFQRQLHNISPPHANVACK